MHACSIVSGLKAITCMHAVAQALAELNSVASSKHACSCIKYIRTKLCMGVGGRVYNVAIVT